MEEEWRIIADFPDYQVSTLGRVKSMKWGREKILESHPKSRTCPYLAVSLVNLTDKKTICIHKLVALAFIPNLENLPLVDHINRNKKDNCVSNLRWVSLRLNSLNQDDRISNTNTGEQYIYFDKERNKYVINRQRESLKIFKRFSTLEEAVAYRDFILNQTPS